MRAIGFVASGAKATRFKLFSQAPIEHTFVELALADGSLLCGEVIDQESVNPHLHNGQILRHSPDRVEGLRGSSIWVTTVQVLALLRNGVSVPPRTPPPPGTAATPAKADTLGTVLGIPQDGLRIGSIPHAEVIFRLDKDLLWSGHLAILGRTGSGKSHLVRLLARQVPKNKGLVIFAFAREYNDCGLKYLAPKDIVLPKSKNAVEMLMGSSRESQFTRITRATQTVHQVDLFGKEAYLDTQDTITGDEIARQIDTRIGTGRTNIADALRRLPFRYGPPSETQKIWCMPVVIDLSSLTIETATRVAAVILEELMAAAIDGHFSKTGMLLVLEEGHTLAPSIGTSPSKPILARLAREGRKHGIYIGLVSQRPRFLDPTILSQCINFFYFHLPYPEDSIHALQFTPYYSEELVAKVRSLSRGQCLLFGNISASPVCVNVDAGRE